MLTRQSPAIAMTDEAWDAALLEHGGHMLQSSAWARVKAAYGWEYERIHLESDAGTVLAQVLFRKLGPVRIAYVPRGPVLRGDVHALAKAFNAELTRVSRRHRAVSVILEPNEDLPDLAGFEPGPDHIQPERTVRVPLLSDVAMLADMHQKTRYNIRLAGRHSVNVRQGGPNDVPAFYALLEDTSERNEFAIHSEQYYRDVLTAFGDDAALLFAEHEGVVSAALIVARFGDEAIYLYGGSSSEHRRCGETAFLQFAAMQWARAQGCSRYDLWGIPVEDPNCITTHDGRHQKSTHGSDMTGLYRFKTGFGGDIVTMPATLERSLVPLVPKLIRKVADYKRGRR